MTRVPLRSSRTPSLTDLVATTNLWTSESPVMLSYESWKTLQQPYVSPCGLPNEYAARWCCMPTGGWSFVCKTGAGCSLHSEVGKVCRCTAAAGLHMLHGGTPRLHCIGHLLRCTAAVQAAAMVAAANSLSACTGSAKLQPASLALAGPGCRWMQAASC